MNDQREKESSVLLSAFRHIEQRLKRTARSMLGCEADAEDVLQDAFVRLWSRPCKLMAPEQAEALLATTVRNLSVDVLRGRSKCPTEEVGENVAEEVEDTCEAERREQMFLTVEKSSTDNCRRLPAKFFVGVNMGARASRTSPRR